MTDGGERFLGAPRFDVVLRGYDRRQVDEHIARLQRVIQRLRADLEISRAQQPPPAPTTPGRGFRPPATPGRGLGRAPEQAPRGPRPQGPDVVGGFTDRMQSILRAAEDEAAEIRRRAHADVGDERLRAQVAELASQRDAMLAELNRLRGRVDGPGRAATAAAPLPPADAGPPLVGHVPAGPQPASPTGSVPAGGPHAAPPSATPPATPRPRPRPSPAPRQPAAGGPDGQPLPGTPSTMPRPGPQHSADHSGTVRLPARGFRSPTEPTDTADAADALFGAQPAPAAEVRSSEAAPSSTPSVFEGISGEGDVERTVAVRPVRPASSPRPTPDAPRDDADATRDDADATDDAAAERTALVGAVTPAAEGEGEPVEGGHERSGSDDPPAGTDATDASAATVVTSAVRPAAERDPEPDADEHAEQRASNGSDNGSGQNGSGRPSWAFRL